MIGQNAAFVPLFNRAIRIVIGITGSTFLILLFDMLFNSQNRISNMPGLNSFLAVGKETLGIYILQDVIIMGLLSKFVRFSFCSGLMFSVAFTPVLSLIILLLSYCIVKLIKRSDKLAFYLLGVQ